MPNIDKKVVIPDGGVPPLAPYSPGIQWDRLIFTSGQIGLDPETGKLVEGGVEQETRQAIKNLTAILMAVDSSLSQILKVTVYISDINNYSVVNMVYAEYFNENPPARAVVQGALPAGAMVEFDAIAFVGNQETC